MTENDWWIIMELIAEDIAENVQGISKEMVFDVLVKWERKLRSLQ